MKLLKIILPVLALTGGLLIAGCCNTKNTNETPVELDANCQLKPEPGPCKAAFTMYYYNPTEKKCKSFIWGGCNGVIPFKTLEECQKKCNCEEEGENN